MQSCWNTTRHHISSSFNWFCKDLPTLKCNEQTSVPAAIIYSLVISPTSQFLTIQHADNLVVIRLLWIISLFSFPVYWRLIAVLYHSYCFQALLVRYILTSLLTKCQGSDPSIKELTIGKVWLTIQTVEVIHLNTWANHLNASSPRFASHFNASSYPFENFLPAVLTLPVICLKIFANHSNALPSLRRVAWKWG